MIKNYCLFLLMILLTFGFGCGLSGETPETIYKTYLSKQIPSGVTQLKGKSSTIGGYTANLSFLADKPTFYKLINETGYSAISHDQVIINAVDYLDVNIKSNPNLYCYYKVGKSEDAKRQEFYLFWDESTQQSYFLTITY